MRSLIKNIRDYINSLINKIDFLDVCFNSETETIVILSIRFHGTKKFVKDFKNSSEWFEYNSYKLYNGVDITKIKKLADYHGGKDYEYVLNFIISAAIESQAVKDIWLSNSRDNKIDVLIN